jgi:hypothetical protein
MSGEEKGFIYLLLRLNVIGYFFAIDITSRLAYAFVADCHFQLTLIIASKPGILNLFLVTCAVVKKSWSV